MNERYYRNRHTNSSNLAFALANEVKQYAAENAEELDKDIWDNIEYWRLGLLSQGVITEESLSEIIDYIGAEKLQELIAIASSKI